MNYTFHTTSKIFIINALSVPDAWNKAKELTKEELTLTHIGSTQVGEPLQEYVNKIVNNF